MTTPARTTWVKVSLLLYLSVGWVSFDDVSLKRVTLESSTQYYYAGGQRVARRVNGGNVQYLFGDHLGSAALVTDSSFNKVSEMRYNAWGKLRYTQGTAPAENAFTYTGQRQEADLGLMFYNSRWYAQNAQKEFLARRKGLHIRQSPCSTHRPAGALMLYSYIDISSQEPLMSFQDGWSAIHLEMPARVPHTEYSIESHWDLVKVVTGLAVDAHSPAVTRRAASLAFQKAWNFDFFWHTAIGGEDVEPWRTDMGHAEYAAGGVDRRDSISCPFKDVEEVLDFDPWEKLGARDLTQLRRRFEASYTAQCISHPFGVNMTGIYISLVSGLIELFGWEMLLTAAGTDLPRFGAMTDRYASWIQQYFNALAAADVPVVMIHDDMVWTSGPIMRLSWYRQHIFPNFKKLIAPLVESGKRVIFTSDGDYSKFIDDIAACGVHGFVLEPTTDMAYMVERYGQTHVIIGNADTRILLSGTRPQIRAEVERCLRLGKNCPGYFLAVGNHIPANTPVENCLYYDEVYRELSRR